MRAVLHSDAIFFIVITIQVQYSEIVEPILR